MGPPFENGGGVRCLPRREPSRIVRLQWGRRSKTAEGDGQGQGATDCAGASMGPPFENGGGSGACSHGLPGRGQASMGPPFENGGGPVGPTVQRHCALQALQWGRRSKTAEGQFNTWWIPPLRSCFNGAAVRKRRRGLRGGCGVGATRGMETRFNGAAVRKRRRVHLGDPGPRGQSGFNGAAVRKRRRDHSHTLGVTRSHLVLQWGRRSKTAEGDHRPQGLIVLDSQASMGPPFENGGGVAPADWYSPGTPASMGPPFENGGGWRRACARSEMGGRASMGPPFENGGGELATERDPKRLAERFNGAAVRKRRRVVPMIAGM